MLEFEFAVISSDVLLLGRFFVGVLTGVFVIIVAVVFDLTLAPRERRSLAKSLLLSNEVFFKSCHRAATIVYNLAHSLIWVVITHG